MIERELEFIQMTPAILVARQELDGGKNVRIFHITTLASGKYEVKIFGEDRKILGEFATIPSAKNAAKIENERFFKNKTEGLQCIN